MKEDIYLYGASGHALVISDIIGLCSNIIYVDDKKVGTYFNNQLVHSPSIISEENRVIISIGDNHLRNLISNRLSCRFGTALASTSIISSSSHIEVGSVVMQGAIIQAQVSVGKHCIVNSGASVDHECKISDYVHISPHATLCGNVYVGEGTWIGAGATIIQGVKIGKWCVIAAGSVVTKDIPDYSLAAGNRCKVIKSLEKIGK